MSSTDDTDKLCDSYEALWKSGTPPVLQDWIAESEIAVSQETLLELLRVDIEYRNKQSGKFDPAEYLQQFGVTPSELVQASMPATDILPPGISASLQKKRFRVSDRVGRFQIRHEVGRGGFGCVYLAHDERLNRDIALKVPRTLLGSESKDRFMREAEAAAALDHVGIVPVYEAGDLDGECYIASAFCDGVNLSEWLKRNGPSAPETAANIVRCLAEAMQHAHNRGVVHRDLKPANVMLAPIEAGSQGLPLPFVPRITDFGLAKLVECSVEDTNSSILLGTPCYMAPEQFLTDTDHDLRAADIYALGVILYELLTGRRPHEGKTVVEVMDAVREGKLRSVREYRPEIAADLETICLKCLSRNPLDRYETCAEIAEDLSSYLLGKPIVARRPTRKERVKMWAKDPRRILETGALTIFLNAAVPIWMTSIVAMVWAEGLEASVTYELIPQAAILFSVMMFPMVWAGYRSLKGSRPWMWFGLANCLFSLYLVVPPLFGKVFVFAEMYARYPLGRIVAYTCATLIYGMQALQYAMLLYFHRDRNEKL